MKTLKILLAGIMILLSFIGFILPSTTHAATGDTPCGDACSTAGGPSGNTASTDTECSNSSDQGINNCLKHNQIVTDLNTIVAFLSAGVGLVVIGVIILGGVQYSMAGDNAQALQAARQRITNGLIALFTFLFIFAFLQWLIPGGL